MLFEVESTVFEEKGILLPNARSFRENSVRVSLDPTKTHHANMSRELHVLTIVKPSSTSSRGVVVDNPYRPVLIQFFRKHFLLDRFAKEVEK